MLPIIIGAGVLTAVAGAATYKYIKSREKNSEPETPPRSLGSFLIWGRPNVGKTTFVNQLRGSTVGLKRKIATESRTVYSDIRLNDLKGGPFVVDKIVDMPGNQDRLDDWLNLVSSDGHVFYLVNLSRLNEGKYSSRVKEDVKATLEALRKSSKARKRINIIASHLDASKWANEDASQVNNVLQEDPEMRLLYESLGDVSGYIYSADLTDPASFNRLLQSIVNDITT